ncbi:MAG: homoserine kinase [Chitinophagaceae bacterium]
MDQKTTVTVASPASVANLVCGFDVLGLSLNYPVDIMQVSISDQPGIRIKHIDDYKLSCNPDHNVAGVALQAMMQELTEVNGFDVVIDKQIKPGSGLGSSAASAAGIVMAANQLLENTFSKEDLVRFAMAGEKLASGVKHADNIAPCIYGGVTLIRSIFPLDIVSIASPELFVTAVHPQIEVKTSDARQILKKEVLLKDAIRQWGNIAGLVAGFMKNDFKLIGRSMEDVIIEPVRSILIPGFNEVKIKSIEAGALGGGISGSGPSIFMLSESEEIARRVEEAMKAIFETIGIDYYTYVTTINDVGIKILQKNLTEN